MRGAFQSDPILATVIHESLRIIIVVALPLSAAVLLAGFLAAALQGFTRIHDHIISYSFRAIAVVLVAYLLYPTMVEGVSRIIRLTLSGT